MLKHTSLIVAGASSSEWEFPPFPSLKCPPWTANPTTRPGSIINTSSDTDKLAPDPQTWKRPGILDWEGMGADVSKHPDKPGHDPMNCGICR